MIKNDVELTVKERDATIKMWIWYDLINKKAEWNRQKIAKSEL